MQAEAIDPEVLGARWEAAMRAGDWATAWQCTDALEAPRRRGAPLQPHHLVWDGTPFDGRSVLVRCEHGLGDTLQFSRFLPALARQARDLHVMAQPHLLALLRRVPGLGQVHDGWAGPDWPAHELEVEVMELAYALRASPATLAPPLPFAAHVDPMRGLDDASGRLRVGLLWAASDWDTSRSVPLQALQPLLAMPHVRWFSLQQGPAAQAMDATGWPIEPLWQRTAKVEDAAAAMQAMNLVVSIDGMPAHLAASLGLPTWLLLKHEADWRWGSAQDTATPWYPSMRLWRQPRHGDWGPLLAEVAQRLRALTCAPTATSASGRPAAAAARSTVAG